jgi:putative hemolysin
MKNTKKRNFPIRMAVCAIILVMSATQASALINPSAAYCDALGYEYTIQDTPKGEVGYCTLPDGETVDAWAFLNGKTGLEWSYCAQQGLEAKHIEDPEVCPSCTICILENGTEVEVMELMGVSLEETYCGDKTCGIPENYLTCPEDCPADGTDGYCNPDYSDTDQDCLAEIDETEEEEAPSPTPSPLSAYIAVLAAMIVAAGLLFRKKS